MRYQEPIYIQNNHQGIRNKDILNVNMSSDMCIFDAPIFDVIGGGKIQCGGDYSGVFYDITTATTIPLSFEFTENLDTFTATSATFSYEIYKYNTNAGVFTQPSVYKSPSVQYSAFSGTNILNQLIPVSSLALDGDYIIKGYFKFNACTEFLNKLGKTIDTASFITGKQYGIYNNSLDYYFTAISVADKPVLLANGTNTPAVNQLFQEVILPISGQTNFVISNERVGFFILTLNGLTLAPNYDYTYSGNIITLSSGTLSDDIITVIYTTSGGNSLAGDNIIIDTPIVSGITDGQGGNIAYYNTDTSKYEIYTSVTPRTSDSIIVMINGVALAGGIDFYQSISNPKRIILEGDILVGDIITIAYFPAISTVNGLITNHPTVSWVINTPPQVINGQFSLEVSNNKTFTSLYSSGATNYEVGKTLYHDSFTASGTVGTTLYYRVKNIKTYKTLCGNTLISTAYSDVIPVVIQTNSINSY